jgi:hypothetical protein
MKYDMHIATEAGNSEPLKKVLSSLGFENDNLVRQGLIFDPETAKHYTSCPLIDIHVSKKIATKKERLQLEVAVDELMIQHDVTGYWHTESIDGDEHIEPQTAFELYPLPFRRLLSRPRTEKKVWDIHLAIRESIMPQALKDSLIGHGLYYLARNKKVPEGGEESFAVYTAQGINPAKEGRLFYIKMCQWLKSIGAPSCDIKFEITTGMEVYKSPRAIPPTVDHIDWQ